MEPAMKSISCMLIEEVCLLSYAENTSRVVLRSVTDEEISEGFKLPPGAVRLELTVTGERAKWYAAHLGDYVTLEVRKRDT
jgi:hypothetical protein